MSSLYQSDKHISAAYVYQKLRDIRDNYVLLTKQFPEHADVIFAQLQNLQHVQAQRSLIIDKYDKTYCQSWSTRLHFPSSIFQRQDLQVLDNLFNLSPSLSDISKNFTEEFLLLKPEDFLNNTDKAKVAVEAIDNVLIPQLEKIYQTTVGHALSGMPVLFAQQTKDNINFEILQARQYDQLLSQLFDEILKQEKLFDELENDLKRFQKQSQILLSKSQFQHVLAGNSVETESGQDSFVCKFEDFSDQELYMLEEGMNVEICLNKKKVLVQISSE